MYEAVWPHCRALASDMSTAIGVAHSRLHKPVCGLSRWISWDLRSAWTSGTRLLYVLWWGFNVDIMLSQLVHNSLYKARGRGVDGCTRLWPRRKLNQRAALSHRLRIGARRLLLLKSGLLPSQLLGSQQSLNMSGGAAAANGAAPAAAGGSTNGAAPAQATIFMEPTNEVVVQFQNISCWVPRLDMGKKGLLEVRCLAPACLALHERVVHHACAASCMCISASPSNHHCMQPLKGLVKPQPAVQSKSDMRQVRSAATASLPPW